MKKNLIFTILMIITIITYPSICRAENTVNFTVSSATAKINDTVDITVNVNNSSNVVAGSLIVSYNPEELELVTTENGLSDIVNSTFFEGVLLAYNKIETGKIKVAFAKENAITNTGISLNLKFKVLKEEGSFPITLEIPEYTDLSNNQISTSITNGTITATKLLKGDVNKDGNVRLYDALQILKRAILGGELEDEELYIMDFNDDGQVTLYDALKFLQQAILG